MTGWRFLVLRGKYADEASAEGIGEWPGGLPEQSALDVPIYVVQRPTGTPPRQSIRHLLGIDIDLALLRISWLTWRTSYT